MSESALALGTERADATATLRRTMVERQLRPYDVNDVPLLERVLAVPRERFLPADQDSLAYSDLPVTLKGAGGRKRRLLPPLVLARLLQGAQVREGDNVLDIGGAGYSAALLSGLAGDVVLLENDGEFAARAKSAFDSLGLRNIRIESGSLEKGAPAMGPYDVIIVHGAVEAALDGLFAQLKPNGRLMAIARLENGAGQQVVRYELCDGGPAGERPLFSAAAPVLEGFQQAPAFAL